MSAFAANLASLARSKLHSGLSSGSRDNLNLHRWVLLKNSISRDLYDSSALYDAPVHDVYEGGDEDIAYEDLFSFLFPDPHDSLVDVEDATVSEAQWLDSLLETLGEDEDDQDDEAPLPVSDLNHSQPPYPLDNRYHPLPAVPYSINHPQPLKPYNLQDSSISTFPPSSPPFESDCPFLLMPDAIEDTSDDESDAPSSPFSSSRSSLSFVDPASIPLPSERTQLEPRVYSESDDSMFNPFDFDPLPYHSDSNPQPLYRQFHSNC